MLSLKVNLRKSEEKPQALRKKGIIPAVLYGHQIKKNFLLTVDKKDFMKVLGEAGESSLISLAIKRQKRPRVVLVKEVQRSPVTGDFLHIDFYEVKMTEKIKAEIALEFIGTVPAVKDLGGVLIKNIDNIEVECLPADLLPKIEVNVASLKTFEDAIRIRDLKIPKNITVLNHPEDVVASVAPPRSEEELAELEEKVEEKVEEVEEVEGVKREETAEGEATPQRESTPPKEEKKNQNK